MRRRREEGVPSGDDRVKCEAYEGGLLQASLR